jgi:hypothetical protein
MLLGKAPLELCDLVSAVTAGFPFHATKIDQRMFLRRTLEQLGISLGYKVFVPFGALPSESSLAVAWWELGRGTVFAAGCDWGNAGDVARAFTHLMTIKAPLKLLMFRSRDAGADRPDILLRSDIGAVLKALGAAIVDFRQHLEGELYVLIEGREQQSFRAYEFLVPTTGKLGLDFEEAGKAFRELDTTLSPCAAELIAKQKRIGTVDLK